jgi:hypothetical protein
MFKGIFGKSYNLIEIIGIKKTAKAIKKIYFFYNL